MKIADTSSQDERLAPKKPIKNLGRRLNQPASGVAVMANYSGSS